MNFFHFQPSKYQKSFSCFLREKALLCLHNLELTEAEMKKYLVIIMAACCLLSGCSMAAQVPQPTAEAPAASAVVVEPLPATINMGNLDNRSLAVSIDKGDIYLDDTGAMRIKFTVYTYDLYDMVDIAALKEGDSISILGEDVAVLSLERGDRGNVIINGGLDVGGHELRTDESGVFYEVGYNDAKSYYAIGEADFSVSPDFVFTDGFDFDNPPVTYYAGDLLTENNGIFHHFVPHNTKIIIENGQIIAMERVYMP